MLVLIRELLPQHLIAIKVLRLQLLHNSRVRIARRSNLEQTIHLVKRHSFCLWDQEPDKSESAKCHAAEQEVHAETRLAHAVDHVWRDARDDKCPEPIGHGREQLSDVARALAEHLSVDNPWRAVPGVDVDGCPEVYHEDGSNAFRRQRRGSWCIRLHTIGDKGTDDEHCHRATDGSEDQKLTTAPLVDKNRQPEDGHNGLDHAEQTGRQIDGVLAVYANGAEDSGL
jgi:hypothetical protein